MRKCDEVTAYFRGSFIFSEDWKSDSFSLKAAEAKLGRLKGFIKRTGITHKTALSDWESVVWLTGSPVKCRICLQGWANTQVLGRADVVKAHWDTWSSNWCKTGWRKAVGLLDTYANFILFIYLFLNSSYIFFYYFLHLQSVVKMLCSLNRITINLFSIPRL